jgi:hypothetical protein
MSAGRRTFGVLAERSLASSSARGTATLDHLEPFPMLDRLVHVETIDPLVHVAMLDRLVHLAAIDHLERVETLDQIVHVAALDRLESIATRLDLEHLAAARRGQVSCSQRHMLARDTLLTSA